MASSPSPPQAQAQQEVPLSERRLADLSDLEIASLNSALKDSEASQRPLVGPAEPLQLLRDEYDHEGAQVFMKKIDALRIAGWRSIRRMRGDGDCFYRALTYAYCERLVDAKPEEARAALQTFDNLLKMIDSLGTYQADITADFYEPLRDLLIALSSANSLRPTHSDLHTIFNDPDLGKSQSIVVFLRILCSAYLKTHADDFAPFLFSLEDDPRFFDEGAPSLEQFCSFYVEAVGKEADNIQITALTRALGVHIRIAYLDQSGPSGGFGEENEVDFHEFEPESPLKLNSALLYRPGHYDLLLT